MSESLRQSAAAGARWLTLATILTMLISFAQNIALGRLLERSEVGLAGMLWAVLGLVQVFNDMGLGNAVVQRKEVSQKELSAVYWVNLLAGAGVSALVLAAGPSIAGFYQDPRLLPLVPWAAASFLLLAVGQPFQAVAQKHLRFVSLAAADIAAGLSACVVAVMAAWYGHGAVSMVWGSLASATMRTIVLVASNCSVFWPDWYWNPREIRALLQFGYYQMADKVMNFLGSNLDYLMVGRFLGADAVGVYRIAYETALRPLSTINPIYNAVAYPIFSRQQDDNAALRRGLLEGLRMIAMIVFPMMAGLAVTADRVIPLLYGDKWTVAAPVLSVLCLLGAIRCVANLAGSILLSKGLVRRSFWLNALNVVLFAGVYSWSAPMGLIPLAWSANAVMLVVSVSIWRWVYGNTIALDWREYLAVLAKPVVFSLSMALAITAIDGQGWFPADRLSGLTARIGAGVVCYGALLLAFDRENMRRLTGVFFHR